MVVEQSKILIGGIEDADIREKEKGKRKGNERKYSVATAGWLSKHQQVPRKVPRSTKKGTKKYQERYQEVKSQKPTTLKTINTKQQHLF